MVKLNFLLGLTLMSYQSQPQFLPQPPIQIKTRTTSVEDLYTAFQKGFCHKCLPNSTICRGNFRIAQNNPVIKFSKKNITENSYNISQVTVVIQNVIGDYSFPKQELYKTSMDYVIYMPKTKQIKGVVLYFHPTLFGVSQIPTRSPVEVAAISSLYVSSGYAVVFPNYLGYDGSKNDQDTPHPYVIYPWQNVKSGMLALNSALKTIKDEYPLKNLFPLFTVGYSQGASYALWFEKCLQSPDNCQGAKLDGSYQYKGAAGLEGPYDLLKVVKPFLILDVQHANKTWQVQSQRMVNFGKPPLLTMTLISYTYYSLGSDEYQKQINKEFWEMKCTPPILQNKCKIKKVQVNLYQAIKSPQDSLPIAQSISFSSFGKTYNSGIKYLSSELFLSGTQNSIYGLTNETFLNQKVFNDTLQNASAINNEPTKNVFLFSLKRDSIVSVNNTQNYESRYPNRVETYYYQNTDYIVCENYDAIAYVDHSGGQVLANIFALAFIKKINGV